MTLPDRIDTILNDEHFEIFSATVDGTPVTVQVFHSPLDDADAAAFRRDIQGMAWITDPPFSLFRTGGITDDGRAFVVRDQAPAPLLSSLSSLDDARQPLTILAGVIDSLASAPAGRFLGHGLRADAIAAPAYLLASGPVPPGLPRTDPVEAFRDIVTQLSGQDAPAADTARGVLDGLRAPEPTPEPTPEPSPVQETREFRPGEQQAPAQPPQQYFPPQQPARKKKRTGAIVASIAIVGLLIGGGVFAASYFLPAWNDAEQEIVDAFPDMTGMRSGLPGHNGLTCQSRDTDEGQLAKITCSDSELGVSIMSWPDAATRDASVPAGETVEIANDSCTLISTELADQENPSYILAPTDARTERFSLLVWGPDAEQQRLALPVC
ncbi:MAG: hypothetical protein Q4G50_07435 [Corynebacterium sp.]|uniref:hypothetical protein n=1 Tax=Corynebacterium sp. TaxID=1720 RepID=UPI0026DFBA25|nr:hypothetical protein [Corynebacterium sp.]MDO5669820.1 hypothetical protein [Corynebacterium sp.]